MTVAKGPAGRRADRRDCDEGEILASLRGARATSTFGGKPSRARQGREPEVHPGVRPFGAGARKGELDRRAAGDGRSRTSRQGGERARSHAGGRVQGDIQQLPWTPCRRGPSSRTGSDDFRMLPPLVITTCRSGVYLGPGERHGTEEKRRASGGGESDRIDDQILSILGKTPGHRS